LLAVILAAAGCARPDEMELRYEAERLRWMIDREEERLQAKGSARSPAAVARLRGLHDEVHRRFGTESAPPEDQLRDADAFRRLRIAGASSLYRADLAALYEPSPEGVEEYARIAEAYAFDRELGWRAWYGRGRLLERFTRWREAVESYAILLERYPPVPPRDPTGRSALPAFDEGFLDLEIHVLVLAERLGSEAPPGVADATISRLRERAEEWAGTRRESHFLTRLAQGLAVRGKWREAIEVLERVRSLSSGEASAEASIAIANACTRGLGDFARAADELHRALEEGRGTGAEAEALLLFVRLELDRKNPAEALAYVHSLQGLRARHREARKGEILYWEARAFAELDRWGDAFPAFEHVAEADPEGSWGILAEQSVLRRWRSMGRVGLAQEAARRIVGIARHVPKADVSAEPPFGWAGFAITPLESARWSECVRALREAAEILPDSTEASAARTEADRIERERIPPKDFTPREPSIKAAASGAEVSNDRETP
jgi:tetratricopeptide (TPR) repeat protein